MKMYGLEISVKNLPVLDKGFVPMAAFCRDFEASAKNGKEIAVAVERNQGQIAVRRFRIHGTDAMREADAVYVDRTVKMLLWAYGGFKVMIGGDDEIGAVIAHACQKPMKCGVLMMRENMSSCIALQQKEPSIRDVYKHLASVFTDFPAFDGWYVDVSHRMRHGCCHIATIEDGDDIVSTALTVSETENAALIGGVATSFTHRKKGYATQCIKTLLSTLPQKIVYIAPVDADAQRLYQSLGFAAHDTWSEISLL